jgi:hypothetical protein
LLLLALHVKEEIFFVVVKKQSHSKTKACFEPEILLPQLPEG